MLFKFVIVEITLSFGLFISEQDTKAEFDFNKESLLKKS